MKKTFAKILALLTTGVMALGIIGCGTDDSPLSSTPPPLRKMKARAAAKPAAKPAVIPM